MLLANCPVFRQPFVGESPGSWGRWRAIRSIASDNAVVPFSVKSGLWPAARG